jgi:hypothetical protein
MSHACAVDGCSRRVVAWDWCDKHYRRWRKYGDPLDPGRYQQRPEDGLCTVEGCEQEHYGRGWCTKHYQRWRMTGDAEHPPKAQVGVVTSYHSAHSVMTARKGRASEQACADCNKQAHHWAYMHHCPDERRDESGAAAGIAWCPHPEHYQPRCRTCHRQYDDSLRVTTQIPVTHSQERMCSQHREPRSSQTGSPRKTC